LEAKSRRRRIKDSEPEQTMEYKKKTKKNARPRPTIRSQEKEFSHENQLLSLSMDHHLQEINPITNRLAFILTEPLFFTDRYASTKMRNLLREFT